MNTIKITDELKARVRDHEGTRAHAYQDTLGKWTIAIGHLIRDHEIEKYLVSDGAGGYKPREEELSADEIEDLFLIDLNRACAGAEQLIGKMYKGERRLPQEIEHVIVEMVFQLGETGVSKFRQDLESTLRWRSKRSSGSNERLQMAFANPCEMRSLS